MKQAMHLILENLIVNLAVNSAEQSKMAPGI